MKNEQLYKETVDIILDAYNDRSLIHGNPCGCFIGNIVKARTGVPGAEWYTEICHPTSIVSKYPKVAHLYPIKMNGVGMEQILATGYSLEEISRLEKAFESRLCGEKGSLKTSFSHGLWGFRNVGSLEGMKAALKVLAEIHETKAEESLERLNKIHEKVYANVL